jgi:hypothetical protein
LQNREIFFRIEAARFKPEVGLKARSGANPAHRNFLAFELLERGDRRRGEMHVIETVGNHGDDPHVGAARFGDHRIGALHKRKIGRTSRRTLCLARLFMPKLIRLYCIDAIGMVEGFVA